MKLLVSITEGYMCYVSMLTVFLGFDQLTK